MSDLSKITELLQNDRFSQSLGIRIVQADAGSVIIEMLTDDSMCNGFGIIHGGVLYSLADTALAFASNRAATKALSIEGSISYLSAAGPGQIIRAAASVIRQGKTVGVYSVTIRDESGSALAEFRGTVLRASRTINNLDDDTSN